MSPLDLFQLSMFDLHCFCCSIYMDNYQTDLKCFLIYNIKFVLIICFYLSKRLSCLTTFCKSCIWSYVHVQKTATEEETTRFFPCPLFRFKTELSDSSATEWTQSTHTPINWLLKTIDSKPGKVKYTVNRASLLVRKTWYRPKHSRIWIFCIESQKVKLKSC